jgi:hypothetical protein
MVTLLLPLALLLLLLPSLQSGGRRRGGCRERWTAIAVAASGEKSVYLLSCVGNQVGLCAFLSRSMGCEKPLE